MKAAAYVILRRKVIAMGYANEISWAEGLKACDNSFRFRDEYCWVVINSGMKEQVARRIWTRIKFAKNDGASASTVFKNKLKCAAIDRMFIEHAAIFDCYLRLTTRRAKMDFLREQPFIGPITVYHFAKNLGMDVAKPDRHLVRIAALVNESTEQMCERIAMATGHSIAVVDTVIWRAANLGLV